MTRRSSWWLLCLANGALAAQAPAPLAEAKGLFTAKEAHAFSCCQRLLSLWRARGEQWDFVRGRFVHPGYELRHCVPDNDGQLQFTEGRDPLREFAGGKCLVYLVPTRVDAEVRRVFCVRGDGVGAFSDNERGHCASGEQPLLPDAVLGEGSGGRLLDFPRTAGKGRDGNFWQPFELVPQANLRLLAVDEEGAPMPMLTVATVPAARKELAIDAVLPAGETRTLLEGDATLSGAVARGLGFVVTLQGTSMPLEPEAVAITGRSARVTVTKSALRQLACGGNESAAIATLKNISSAQAQCQASGVIDTNKNGAGEYGMFAELSGVKPVRGGTAKISPPVLSTAFGKVEGGIVVRSGYCFRMFLPGKEATAVGELPAGGAEAATIDGKQAEVCWCAYAWPVVAGETGQRIFFIDQGGDVLSAPNAEGLYAGKPKPPDAGAARAAGTAGKLDDPSAANAQGRDGQGWRVQS